jgi:hypothetical protein
MKTQVAGTSLEKLFDRIREIRIDHGAKKTDDWRGWPNLNKYHPSPYLGNYLVTSEYDRLMYFCSQYGKHEIGHPGIFGDEEAVFATLQKELALELTADLDGFNSLTYKGHRVKYWKINHADYCGDLCGKPGTEEPVQQLSRVVEYLQGLE